MLGTIMIPMLAAYMAYSLGDKTALAPGFAAGVAANLINGVFLCAMLGGLVAGYSIRFLGRSHPGQRNAGRLRFFLALSGFRHAHGRRCHISGSGKAGGISQCGPDSLPGFCGGSNGAVLGAILGIMVSFDLGGPVNKAAYTFCVGAMAEGILMPYAAFASVKMVSGFAITAATVVFKGTLFTKEEREAGSSTSDFGFGRHYRGGDSLYDGGSHPGYPCAVYWFGCGGRPGRGRRRRAGCAGGWNFLPFPPERGIRGSS